MADDPVVSSTAGGPPPQDAPYGALPQDRATAPPPAPAGRVWAAIVHLSFFVLPVVGAAVVRLTVGRRDAFVRHHATQALNAQLGVAVVVNGFGFTLARAVFRAGSNADEPPQWLLYVGVAVVGLTVVSTLVGSLVGAVRAHAGVWWRYPFNALFVRDAVREGQLPR